MGCTHTRPLVASLFLAVLLLFLAAGPAALAGPRAIIIDPAATPSWVQTLAGPAAGTDAATDVALLGGDVTLVLGTLTNAAGDSDISLTKYRGSVKQWTKVWNGPGHSTDVGRKMVVTADGKWAFLCGTAMNSGGTTDIWVLKRSVKSGSLSWARKYDGPAHGNDVATAIGLDAGNNVVCAGSSMNAANADYAVASWKSSGARRWTWRWDGKQGGDMVFDLLVAGDGTSYVTGLVTVSGPKVAAGTVRLSPAGKKLWLKKYLGPAGLGAGGTSIAARPGGGIYVAGLATGAATAADGMVLRYSTRGGLTVVAIDQGAGGTTAELFWDVAVTPSKAVIVGGSSATAGVSKPHVSIYRPDGTTVLTATAFTVGSDAFTQVAADAFGGWYAMGTKHTAPAVTKVWIYRNSLVPQAGLWSCDYGPDTPGNAPAAMAVRGVSCAVAGQVDTGGASGIDQLLLKIDY